MTEIERRTGMSDAECEYWDDYITHEKNIKLGENLLKKGIKPGFAHHSLLLKKLDEEAAEYVRTQAQISHKSEIEIINDLIREKIAVGI
jgi:hypothetical protein